MPQTPPVSLPLVTTSEVPLYTGHLTGQLDSHLREVSRNRLAERITGGLSRPGKMPCAAWGVPASRCRVGSALAGTPGTVCHEDVCYAKRRNYRRRSVQDKLEERYRGLFHDLWVPSMIFLVNYHCDGYFRLFDSGDLCGANHYRNVVTLARHVPQVKIWMPTREIQVITAVHEEMALQGVPFPANLVPRISANMIDGKPPRGFPYTSAVISDAENASCVAPLQKNRCDGEKTSCRACWAESHVTYPLH